MTSYMDDPKGNNLFSALYKWNTVAKLIYFICTQCRHVLVDKLSPTYKTPSTFLKPVLLCKNFHHCYKKVVHCKKSIDLR